MESHKQISNKLSISFASIKVGNTLEELLYKIRQIYPCLYKAKGIKKGNNNVFKLK